MKKIFDICKQLLEKETGLDAFKSIASSYNIYPDSINEKEGSTLFLAKINKIKSLIILEQSSLFEKFEGELILSNRGKICPLNYSNCEKLREIFPFTAPISHKEYPVTVGLGDRLGLASAGHLRLAKKYKFFPVLAQQSIRELNLTGRTYRDVLDAASWAVFQEGYRNGFGADGDHLKTEEEVQMAINYGFTMITLDCSEHIDNTIYEMTETQMEQKYLSIPEKIRKKLENKYIGKTFPITKDFSICFNEVDFKKIVLVYLDTIEHTNRIYKNLLLPLDNKIDFEISIDETLFTTSIEAHYFVALELTEIGVKITSLAPRFCGEFQKAIDYVGEDKQFEEEFLLHFLISQHFGYKLSIHSGSDKFRVFSTIGRITNQYFHLKTAGTNWLEAVRVIAVKNPALFREMYKYGAEHLEKAKTYYHIKASTGDIISLNNITDENLPNLMDDDNVRQILHVTYGVILQAKNEDESSLFNNRIFELLNTFEEEYCLGLYKHIGKHLDLLGIEKSTKEE